jgi:hypothetical protein
MIVFITSALMVRRDELIVGEFIPSPFLAVRRLAVGLASAAVLFSIFWVALAKDANSKILEHQASYRAHGVAAIIDDLQTEAKPGEAQAYLWLLAAGEELTLDPTSPADRPAHRSYWLESGADDEERHQVERLLKRQAPSLELAKKAVVSAAHMNLVPLKPGEINPPDRDQIDTVVHLVLLRSELHHQTGDDDGFLQDIADLFQLARILESRHLVVDHAEALAVMNSVIENLLEAVPELQAQAPDHPHGFTDQSARAVIGLLLDDEDYQDDLRLSLQRERAYDMFRIDQLCAKHPLMSPMLHLQAATLLDAEDNMLTAVGVGVRPYPAVQDILSPWEATFESRWTKSGLLLMGDLLTACEEGIGGVVVEHYSTMNQRHAAAVCLAIHVFREEHDGHLPKRLAELVPVYLPRLPFDPFSPTGASFIYVPERRLFYSVGQDRVDGGGSTKDIVFPLEPPASE